MPIRRAFAVPVALGCVVWLSTFVLAGAGDVPVTTTVSDYDSGVAASLQIQSDKAGSYVNSRTLTSVIQSVGDWVLDSYYVTKATRTVYLGFNQPIAGTGPNGGDPIAMPSGYYRARFITKCHTYGNSMLTLAPGATMACPFHVHFDYNGSTYDIDMNPFSAVAPETNSANVTCIYPSSGSGACKQWRIAPSASVVNSDGSITYQNVGALLREDTKKGTTTLVRQGDFYFSFMVLVSNP